MFAGNTFLLFIIHYKTNLPLYFLKIASWLSLKLHNIDWTEKLEIILIKVFTEQQVILINQL